MRTCNEKCILCLHSKDGKECKQSNKKFKQDDLRGLKEKIIVNNCRINFTEESIFLAKTDESKNHYHKIIKNTIKENNNIQKVIDEIESNINQKDKKAIKIKIL